MKLEALTGRVLQSAFNNFAKFTVKHLYLSIFLIKLQAWWCATLSRKKVKENSVSFPKFLRRLALCRTCLERIFEWYEPKKILFAKSIYKKTPVMAFFLVQLQMCGLKSFLKGSSSRCFSMKIVKFYRTSFLHNNAARLLLVSFDIFNVSLLFYQW